MSPDKPQTHLITYSNVAVLGWGWYVPEGRVGVEEVGKLQGKDGKAVGDSLGIKTKSQAELDEDAFTLAWEASRRAIKQWSQETIRQFDNSTIEKKSEDSLPASKSDQLVRNIGAIYVGSESHPYAVKPTASMLGEVLGVGHEYLAADLEFACKAGTAGIQMIASHVAAGAISAGLAVGSDVSQSKPGDVLGFSAAAGAGALILGKTPSSLHNTIRLTATYSFTSDTPDFWRRQDQKFPEHGGRFTGEPGYFAHVVEAGRRFLVASGVAITDFDHVVLHMPNGKFPKKAAKILGVSQAQLSAGFVVEEIGNPYSGSSMVGMCRALASTLPGQKVLVISYGSGSGSDVLMFERQTKVKSKK